MGCCQCCCFGNSDLLWYDCLRSCPFISSIGFTLTAVGSGLALSQRAAIEEAFTLLHIADDFGQTVNPIVINHKIVGHWGKLAVAAEHYLWPIYIATIIFNSISLFVAFADSGKTREYLFGPVSTHIGYYCQIFTGPGLAMVICVVAFFAFILHLAIVCAILPSTPIILLAYAACKKGGFVIAGLATALELSGMVGNAFEIVVLGDFCRVQKHFSVGITVLVSGGIMSVIGQVMVLMGATYNHVRLYAHIRETNQTLYDKDAPSYDSTAEKASSDVKAALEDSPKMEVMAEAA